MLVDGACLTGPSSQPYMTPMKRIGARSSAGEHSLHTGGVTGSIPVVPTILLKIKILD